MRRHLAHSDIAPYSWSHSLLGSLAMHEAIEKAAPSYGGHAYARSAPFVHQHCRWLLQPAACVIRCRPHKVHIWASPPAHLDRLLT